MKATTVWSGSSWPTRSKIRARRSNTLAPFGLILLLSFGSGAAALIYEIGWFQLLELVLGSTAVSLAILLASFMGGMCIGSLLLPRVVSDRSHPLRVYALIELGIGVCGLVALLLMPLLGSYGRGFVASICLLPPTLLMGSTLPVLSRVADEVSSMGFLYGANIAGAVCGCLLSGFYLLRVYDVSVTTWVAVGINVALAVAAVFCPSGSAPSRSRFLGLPEKEPRLLRNGATVYIAIALSGLCALAAETIWTRLLGLLIGPSVYAFSIILAVFLIGLGIGSGVGSVLGRILSRADFMLGWYQILVACAIAWAAYNLDASLPYWPVNPELASNIWLTFELDFVRAFWALLPATILWGASFPLALAAARSKGEDSAKLMAAVYSANTFGAIIGALLASLLLVAWVGSQHAQQWLIGFSVVAGLLLLRSWKSAAALPLAGLLIYIVPPVAKPLIAYGRYAATWAGKSDIVYAREGRDASVAVAQFANGAVTFHVAGKIQASNVPRDMRLQRMLGHLTTLPNSHPARSW